MQRSHLLCLGGLIASMTVAACNKSTSAAAPTSPNGGTVMTANSDGTTMKLVAPSPTAPANGSTLGQGVSSATLQATAATGEFTTASGLAHRFEIHKGSISGPVVASRFAAPSGSTVSVDSGPLDFFQTYAWRVRAEYGADAGPWSSAFTFSTSGQPRRDARTYPGNQVPRSLATGDLKTWLSVVAGAHPTELQASCNNGRNALDFPTVLLQTLRTIDNRWGFNCRRGNCSDPSNDVVVYHWGVGSSEGSIQVYIYDVIGGLDAVAGCKAQIVDVTDSTFGSGTVGQYSLLGRFPPNNPDY